MGLATRFIPHSVEILTGPVFIDGIESTNPEGGVELFEESAGSETDRELVATKRIAPTIPIVTSDLSALATVGMSGLASFNASNSIIVYGRELPFGSTPTVIATTDHIKLTCTDGLLVPESIRGGEDQVAKLSMRLHAALGTGGSSGATPLVRAASSAITSGAGALVKIYTASIVKYTISGGSSRLVDGIQDLNVDFGIGVNKEGSGGQVYHDHLSIISRMSRIEFTTADAAIIAEIGDGIAVSAFAGYYQKTLANGTDRVGKGTAGHIGISGAAGLVVPSSLTLTHKQSGRAAFSFIPAKSTTLLTIATTATIPTS